MAKSEKKTNPEAVEAGRLDFESRYEKLNACVAELESGRLSLDESLKAYRDGIDLVSQCRAILEQAQAQVESIESIDETGEYASRPLDLETERHEALRSLDADTANSEDPF